MHKDTEMVLERILEQSRRDGGVIEELQGGNDDNHIDWLFEAGYLWSAYEPVRTFDGTVYMNTMPTEKGYEWERKKQETTEGQARAIEARLEEKLAATKSMRETVQKLDDEAGRVGKAWCGSSMGNHAKVYYDGLEPVPPEAYWDTEWGMEGGHGRSRRRGVWRIYTIDEVKNEIYSRCGTTEAEISDYADRLFRTFEEAERELLGILEQSDRDVAEATRERLLKDTKAQRSSLTTADHEAARMAQAHMASMSRDRENIAQGAVPAAHHHVLAGVEAVRRLEWGVEQLGKIAGEIHHATRRQKTRREGETMHGSKVFIGHDGRSHAWRAVKDHLEAKGFIVEEFERAGVAGKQVKDRLEEMMEGAGWAVLVITARDTGNGTVSANVIHEIGYAQGRLGWEKAIILLQGGCELPSNLSGTVRLGFKDENVKSVFADLIKALGGEEHH